MRSRAAVKRTAAKPAEDEFKSKVMPQVRKYCGGCHGTQNPPSGLALLQYRSTAAMVRGHDVWERVVPQLRATTNPPKGAPQPTVAERGQLADQIEATLSSAECQLNDPGRVTMRRLNREEYNNTIRDLFGVVNLRPADSFPSDDVGYGFDNIGDVLSISPLLMEK